MTLGVLTLPAVADVTAGFVRVRGSCCAPEYLGGSHAGDQSDLGSGYYLGVRV